MGSKKDFFMTAMYFQTSNPIDNTPIGVPLPQLMVPVVVHHRHPRATDLQKTSLNGECHQILNPNFTKQFPIIDDYGSPTKSCSY